MEGLWKDIIRGAHDVRRALIPGGGGHDDIHCFPRPISGAGRIGGGPFSLLLLQGPVVVFLRWKHHKYSAKKVTLDGYTFDSKAEGRRYEELKLLVSGRKIHGLETHPKFFVVINGQEVCKIIMDFSYYQDGKLVVEDVKGVRTQTYRLKKRLLEATHGIKIIEIPATKKLSRHPAQRHFRKRAF